MSGSTSPCKSTQGAGPLALALLAISASAVFTGAAAQDVRAGAAADRPSAIYWVYVGAESADLIHRVRFGPDGAAVEKTTPVGMYPTEMEGPHGLSISADGK